MISHSTFISCFFFIGGWWKQDYNDDIRQEQLREMQMISGGGASSGCSSNGSCANSQEEAQQQQQQQHMAAVRSVAGLTSSTSNVMTLNSPLHQHLSVKFKFSREKIQISSEIFCTSGDGQSAAGRNDGSITTGRSCSRCGGRRQLSSSASIEYASGSQGFV